MFLPPPPPPGMEYGCEKPKFIEETLVGEIWDELAPILTENCLLLPLYQHHLAMTCQLLAEHRQVLRAGKSLPMSRFRIMMKYLDDWGMAGPRSRAKYPWLAGRV